ncbi:N-acetylmuramoyl-L-alanine amidase [Pseudorhizobium tarimense]|uniref:N-acetylmuramoyl-L-alanine amidase n=1 Tax=Pseudorhizobium tarimense TaxID=1079109 RepID=A0ABV2H5D7_9HYPH|nr:N-acetylmuramoyl-L-alanine amidase [Pseudorhizobium tarimense]MCJ8518962.1 N-acetylmuramoyl-L-alanine amidase [Pseudorhizobium tarimense]
MGRSVWSACLRERIVQKAAAVLLVLASGQLGFAEAAAPKPLLAYAARIAGDEARTRIVIDFEEKPEFSVHYVAAPERVVVDLPATAFGFKQEDLSARGLFKDIRYGTMDESSARIVLTAKRPVQLTLAEVQESDSGYRLVLDAEMATAEAFEALVRKQSWETDQEGDRDTPIASADDGEFVVAVDAGHGGIDAGATGVETKTPEKEITLSFAKAVADRLNAKPGIRAYLTRDDDTFLTLSERVTLARQAKADLFLSLHADTLSQRDIRGATVYTLSDRASDRMAENLAARENLSDELAGVSLKDEPPEVADILMDLTRRETQAFSITLAQNVLDSFEGQVGLINNAHRYAGFQVLRAPDIPSVLLELGFLSNPEDEKLLLDQGWREKVSGLLVDSVERYKNLAVANGG